MAREAQLEERRLWNEKEQQAIDKIKAAGIEIITISYKIDVGTDLGGDPVGSFHPLRPQ